MPYMPAAVIAEVLSAGIRRCRRIDDRLLLARLTGWSLASVGLGLYASPFAAISLGAVLVACIAVHFLMPSHQRLQRLLNAVIDLTAIVALRFGVGAALPIDPDAAMVALAAIVTLAYVAYGDPLLSKGVGALACAAITGSFVLLIDYSAGVAVSELARTLGIGTFLALLAGCATVVAAMVQRVRTTRMVVFLDRVRRSLERDALQGQTRRVRAAAPSASSQA